jgi:hypothetical protein
MNMNTLDKIMAMDDKAFVPRREVARVCTDCADKMSIKGIQYVRASVIKAALVDSEVKRAVSQTPKLEFTQLPNKKV